MALKSSNLHKQKLVSFVKSYEGYEKETFIYIYTASNRNSVTHLKSKSTK